MAAEDGSWIAIPGGADCEHGSLAQLGADTGANQYYRCEDCGTVLIRAGQTDYREVREQLEDDDEGGDSPLGGVLGLEGAGTGSDREPGDRPPGTGAPVSSSLLGRLRSFGERLFR